MGNEKGDERGKEREEERERDRERVRNVKVANTLLPRIRKNISRGERVVSSAGKTDTVDHM